MKKNLVVVHDIIHKTRSGEIKWVIDNLTDHYANYNKINYKERYSTEIYISYNKKLYIHFNKTISNDYILNFIFFIKNKNSTTHIPILRLFSNDFTDLILIYHSIKYQLRY